MGFVALQNDQRIRYDMSIAMMIHLARTFELKPEVVKVTWLYENGKWMPDVALPQPPHITVEQTREVIQAMYAEARRDLVAKLHRNRDTRFHG